MPMNMRRIALYLVLLTAAGTWAADPPALRILVETDKPDAVYTTGERVEFRIRLMKGSEAVIGQTLYYRLSLDNFRPLHSGSVVSAAEPVAVVGQLDQPGFLRCDVTEEGEPGATRITAAAAAAIDPLQIPPSLPVPDNFDTFWAKRKALLASEPLRPKLTAVASATTKAAVFDVEVNCPGSATPVRGYLAKPADAKPHSLPALLTAQAAGVGSANIQSAVSISTEFACLALDLNAHGILNGQPKEFYTQLEKGELAGYPRRDSGDPDRFYFNGMYLRLMRAIEFLAAQPEWDGRTIIVRGSSQGAGQAIAAAGLDPRVTLIVANVPAMCDHTGSLVGRTSGWPQLLAGKDAADPSVASTIRYFDAMNLGTRAKAEAVFLVGFIDSVTPPASIYAMYNAYAGPKRIINIPDMGHEARPAYSAAVQEAVRAHLTKQAAGGASR